MEWPEASRSLWESFVSPSQVIVKFDPKVCPLGLEKKQEEGQDGLLRLVDILVWLKVVVDSLMNFLMSGSFFMHWILARILSIFSLIAELSEYGPLGDRFSSLRSWSEDLVEEMTYQPELWFGDHVVIQLQKSYQSCDHHGVVSNVWQCRCFGTNIKQLRADRG